MENYYEILQLPEKGTMDEIKKALDDAQRKWLGRVNLPDLKRRQEAELKLEIIDKASVILLDEAKRKKYDEEIEADKFSFKPVEEQKDTTNFNEAQLIDEVWELLRNNRVADAVVVGKRATERYAGNADAWAALARAHYSWGEYDDAIYEYKKAIDIATNNAVYYYDLSDVYYDHPGLSAEDTFKHMESLINKALQINPTERAYLYRLAFIKRCQAKPDEAMQILRGLIDTYGREASFCDEMALNLIAKTQLNMWHTAGYYIFASKESAEKGLVFLEEAEKYAMSYNIKQDVETYKNNARAALKNKVEYLRLIGIGAIPAIWFLISLANFSIINMLISGGLLYLAFRFSSIPAWKDNLEVVSGKREATQNTIAVLFKEISRAFKK